MNLTKRQMQILDILLSENRETTLGRIASLLNVSTRTVHREIARMASSLERDYGLALAARSGFGLKVVGNLDDLDTCRRDLSATVPSDLSPEERRRMLAFLLIEASEVLKLYSLAKDLFTSSMIVRHDLDMLQPWFALHGLELTLRKGLGLRLDGPESKKRQALCTLIQDQFGEAGLLRLIRDENADYPLRLDDPELLALRVVPADCIRYAERTLAGLSKELLPALAPQDYLGLVVMLAVAVVRKRLGFDLEPGEPRSDSGAALVEKDVRRMARVAVAGVFSRYSMEADESEQAAVARYMYGARPERPGSEVLASNMGSIADVMSLIGRCAAALGRDFSQDRVLRDGLVAHWGPAIHRLRNNFPIRNPLLEKIRGEYADLFQIVRQSCYDVFADLEIPDDEVGYLVLHFGSALSRSDRGRSRFRALVVCSAGIGSAHMLASRIREALPEIEIVANLSWFDIRDTTLEGWDLLISTIPLPLEEDDYVLVDPLLSSEGIRAIRRQIERRRGLRAESLTDHEAEPEESGLGELRIMSRNLSAAVSLLERMRVFEGVEGGSDWDCLLSAAVRRCVEADLVKDGERTLRDLRARSTDHGILLPGSGILFLHARSIGTVAPSFTVHHFSMPLELEIDTWESKPRRLALMLAPQRMDKETLGALNEISVSLLDGETVGLLKSADESSLRDYYSRYLNRFFRTATIHGGYGNA